MTAHELVARLTASEHALSDQLGTLAPPMPLPEVCELEVVPPIVPELVSTLLWTPPLKWLKKLLESLPLLTLALPVEALPALELV